MFFTIGGVAQEVEAVKIYLRNFSEKYTVNEDNKRDQYIESKEGDYEINTFTDLQLTVWHGNTNIFVGTILNTKEVTTATTYQVIDNYGRIAIVEVNNNGHILFLYRGFITYYINK